MRWQYQQILTHLSLLQDHVADPSCPCTKADVGEYCVPKHLLTLSGYAAETMSMEENTDKQSQLMALQEEASHLHEQTRHVVCGVEGSDAGDIVTWTRQWRKLFETDYYACDVPHGFANAEQSPSSNQLELIPSTDETSGIPRDLQPFRIETRLVRHSSSEDFPSLTSPASVIEFARDLDEFDRERLIILYVDTQNRLIGAQESSVGDRSSAMVPLDSIVRTALLANAAGVFILHNHPSGNPVPSNQDLQLIPKLRESLGLIDVELIDHIVVGDSGRFTSIRERNPNLFSSSVNQNQEIIEIVYPAINRDVVLISGADPVADPDTWGSRCRDDSGRFVPSIWCSLPSDVPDADISDRTFAVGANGLTRYEFRFRVVEGDELIISNDPLTFEVNPDFPPEIQPRQRNRSALRNQVKKIAAGLEPSPLLEDLRTLNLGPPIVGPDLVVEGGNGRTMAIIQAATDHPEKYQAYRSALEARARRYGLRTAAIHEMTLPILVRERLTDVADRAEFARETNRSPGISSSMIEQADVDASRISLRMLESLEFGENDSIGDALRAARNAGFVTRFLGTLTDEERAELIDSRGSTNTFGILRITVAIFLRAFPGEEGLRLAELAFESADEEIRNVVNAVSRSLGPLAVAEGLIQDGDRAPELTIASDVAKVANVFARIKATPALDVEKFIAQGSMFERELDAFQESLIRFFERNKRSANRMALALRHYGNLVQQAPPPGQSTLIDLDAPEKQALWTRAMNFAEGEIDRQIAFAAAQPAWASRLVDGVISGIGLAVGSMIGSRVASRTTSGDDDDEIEQIPEDDAFFAAVLQRVEVTSA